MGGWIYTDPPSIAMATARPAVTNEPDPKCMHACVYTPSIGWWIILSHANKVVIAMERVENLARAFTHELKVRY